MKKRVIVAGIASALILSGTNAFAVDTTTPPVLNCQTGEVVSTTYNATTQLTTYTCVAAPAPLPTPTPTPTPTHTTTPAPTPTPTPAPTTTPNTLTCSTGQRLSAIYSSVTRITTYSCTSAPVVVTTPTTTYTVGNQASRPQVQQQGQGQQYGVGQTQQFGGQQGNQYGNQYGNSGDDFITLYFKALDKSKRLGCFNNTYNKNPSCPKGNFDSRISVDGFGGNSNFGANQSSYKPQRNGR